MEDHKDEIEKPKFRINHDLLVQMADIYTHKMYYKFEEELCYSLNYRVWFVRETDNHRVYQIQRKKIETCKIRELVYDKELDLVYCVCKKFESTGIPCKHILAYLMKVDDIELLPDKYISKRWTKSVKLMTVVDDKGEHIEESKSYVLMRSQLVQSSLDLVDKALAHEETRKILTDGLQSINEKIDQFLDQVRAKGCGKRLKGGKEKALAKSKNGKSRRCHGCGKTGQSHDKRNCPARLNPNSSNMDANLEEEYGSSTEEDEDDIG